MAKRAKRVCGNLFKVLMYTYRISWAKLWKISIQVYINMRKWIITFVTLIYFWIYTVQCPLTSLFLGMERDRKFWIESGLRSQKKIRVFSSLVWYTTTCETQYQAMLLQELLSNLFHWRTINCRIVIIMTKICHRTEN